MLEVAVFLVTILFPFWYMSQNACYFFFLVFSLLFVSPLDTYPNTPLLRIVAKNAALGQDT